MNTERARSELVNSKVITRQNTCRSCRKGIPCANPAPFLCFVSDAPKGYTPALTTPHPQSLRVRRYFRMSICTSAYRINNPAYFAINVSCKRVVE